MKNVEYVVEPVISKLWFCKPKVKWAVTMKYEYWDNHIFSQLSCWRETSEVLHKFLTKEEAYNFVNIVKDNNK